MGVETRSSEPARKLRGPKPGRNITNIGAGRPWEGWLGRVKIFHEGLRNVSAKDPDQMVILLDMSDMMFGGCSDEEVMQHYRFAAEHGGAPVVFGATVFLQPNRLGKEYRVFEPRRKSVLDAAGLDYDVYCRGHDEFLERLGKSTGYSYLNAGFVMGPAAKVLEVFQGMLAFEEEVVERNHRFDDQMAANLFMLAHEDKVTLDYTGRLVLTEDGDVIKCHDGELWLEHVEDHLVNTWTGKTACFVHGAGGGWRSFRNFSFWPKH